MLCGNCHSQTDNYGGRNAHRRRRDGHAGEEDDSASRPPEGAETGNPGALGSPGTR